MTEEQFNYLIAKLDGIKAVLIENNQQAQKSISSTHQLESLRSLIHSMLDVKTGWGRNEIKIMLDAAIDEANNTSFGLSAGLLSDSEDLYNHFFRRIRAGIGLDKSA